tara:strand:- start:101 stop:427 length:327 start_codon:yes stop_codon:yes gene_type:complete
MIAAIILFIVVKFEGESMAINSAQNLFSMLAYGIISHVFGWYMIILGLKAITATTAGIILISQPIFSLIWEYLIFSRVTNSTEIIGISIVIVAMIVCVSSEKVLQSKD